MSRLLPLSLLALSLLGASLGRAADFSRDFYLPVSYDMVITRSVPKTSGDTAIRTAIAYEIFTSRDLLRSILEANEVTALKNWSLVALGSFGSNPGDTDTLSSLRIAARNRKTGELLFPTAELALGIAPVSSVAAYRRVERQTGEEATVVSSSSSLLRVAEFDQKLPARVGHAAGALVATGLATYTNTYGKVTAGGVTTPAPVLRITAGTFRASGQYQDDEDPASDGLAEVLITFGAPTYFTPEIPEG